MGPLFLPLMRALPLASWSSYEANPTGLTARFPTFLPLCWLGYFLLPAY
jgi:hypothetical protein